MEIINAENIATGEAKTFTIQQWMVLREMQDTEYKFVSKGTSPTAPPKAKQANTATAKTASASPRKCSSCNRK